MARTSEADLGRLAELDAAAALGAAGFATRAGRDSNDRELVATFDDREVRHRHCGDARSSEPVNDRPVR